VLFTTGGAKMNEKEINAIIEKSITEYKHCERIPEKIQYVMDFGEVTVQYDFCLN
jgi:hypothetical protein